MELEELKPKIKKTIDLFFKHDCFLIENNVNERFITHKLAEYLQLEFPEYHVDCEYNRMMKKFDFIKKTLKLKIKNIESDDTEAVTVYPDIIVHHRKNKKNKLLIIEVKKSTNRKRELDRKKLEAFTRKSDGLDYEWGLFLIIGYENREMEWYKKGERVA